MGRLREKMTGDLELRGRLPNTRTAYLGCVKRFAAYHGQAPDRLGLAEVEAFLLYLTREKQASAATLAVYAAALRFFYGVTLGRKDLAQQIPVPRVPKRLPTVLSGTEVDQVLEALDSPRHRAVLSVA